MGLAYKRQFNKQKIDPQLSILKDKKKRAEQSVRNKQNTRDLKYMKLKYQKDKRKKMRQMQYMKTAEIFLEASEIYHIMVHYK